MLSDGHSLLMDVPDLVRERLGDEEITAGVSIGDEDAVCLTPTRTLVYRGEGILSDEHVEEFPHDIERLSVKEGRRKTKFAIEYVGGTETFTVPSDRGDKALELLLQGVLRHEGVLGRRESIAGVYRFTELTLVITDSRVLKHIGNVVWDEDFENYPFERVTGLEFERSSNATSVAIEIDGRPQRVKVPNETAGVVRQTLEEAIFGYYGVDSLEALNAAVGTTEPESAGAGAPAADDIGFESDIDPLVTQGDGSEETPDGLEQRPDRVDDSAVPNRMDVSPGSSEDEAGRTASDDRREPSDSFARDPEQPETDRRDSGTEQSDAGSRSGAPDPSRETDDTEFESATDARSRFEEWTDDAATDDRGDHSGGTVPLAEALDYEPASSEDLAAVASQVEELTDAVERQNELLKRQHKALEELVAEIRSE
jgi:hypothetical protein